MKSRIRNLASLLPIVLIAWVVLAIAFKFYTSDAKPLGKSGDRPKIVTVPQSRKLPQSEQRQVISVWDGDSITVKSDLGKEKIRLCGIDAPELAQPLGTQSRNNLRSLIAAAGNQVYITPIEKDRYGRTVAEAFLAGKNQEKLIQEEQLKNGMAYVYEQYVDGCPNADSMRGAEVIARNNHVGVWGGNYIKPWDYRRTKG